MVSRSVWQTVFIIKTIEELEVALRRSLFEGALIIMSGLEQLEATAVQRNLGGRPVKLLGVYIAPNRPILDDMSECFRGSLPVLMAGDPNAKHNDWNSRVKSRKAELLREYVSTNSCIVYGPTTQTTAPFSSANQADVLDTVIVKEFVLPVTDFFDALSSDHLPVLVDNPCRASFNVPPHLPNLKRVDWANLQDHLATGLPGGTRVETMEDIDASLETLTKANQNALRVALPKRRPDEDRSRGTLLPSSGSINCKDRLTTSLRIGGMNSGLLHSSICHLGTPRRER